VDSVTAAALVQASQIVAAAGLYGLASLLLLSTTTTTTGTAAVAAAAAAAAFSSSTTDATASNNTNTTTTAGSSNSNNTTTSAASPNTALPSPEAVRVAATKACLENPPWVHWSKNDSAAKVVDKDRLSVQAAPVQGYRMARASAQAVNNSSNNNSNKTTNTNNTTSGQQQYWECLVQPGPSASAIADALPANARLGPVLQRQLQAALEYEQSNNNNNNNTNNNNTNSNNDPAAKRRKLESDTVLSRQQRAVVSVGGHVRLGWSMRTGDLQAPVGYDKWSYGIRDTAGSLVHCSQRQDEWTAGTGQDASFGSRDVIGSAIQINTAAADTSAAAAAVDDDDDGGGGDANANADKNADKSTNPCNEIRFFKNGECLGQFVLSKGKRVGGVAFDDVQPGSYYPAVSCYMGGSIVANFGPYWIHPPRRKLPVALGKLVPLSVPPPADPKDVVAAQAATAKLFRRPDQQQAFLEAVRVEAQVLRTAWEDYMERHVAMVRREREARGLSTADLPEVKADDANDTASGKGKSDAAMDTQ